MIGKVCPLVLHPGGAPLRLLAFTHPITGAQIVKGTIEPGEHPTRAAARELWEE
ncbi:MAG: NUDIX domain-containing protein, partial [Pseudomonadota bacterium]